MAIISAFSGIGSSIAFYKIDWGVEYSIIVDWLSKHHPDDVEFRRLALERYLNGEVPVYSYDYRTKGRDGEWCWISTRGMLFSRSSDGRPLRMIGTHTNIDERKNLEQKLVSLENTDPLTGGLQQAIFY